MMLAKKCGIIETNLILNVYLCFPMYWRRCNLYL